MPHYLSLPSACAESNLANGRIRMPDVTSIFNVVVPDGHEALSQKATTVHHDETANNYEHCSSKT